MALLFRFGLWCAARFSQRGAQWIATKVAALLLLLQTDGARATQANIRACFAQLSDAEQQTLVKESLTHMVLLVFEFAQLLYWPRQELLSQISDVQGKEILDEAYASGRGVLLLVPHFGNWEVMCAFLGVNYNFAALYDPPKIASLENTILRARQRFDGQLFAIDTGGMRQLMRVLKAGELVAVLPDQVPDRNAGVYADFYNQPALTMTLSHRIMSKHRPVAIMGSVQRVDQSEGYGYRLRFDPLADGLADVPVEQCVRQINAAIERVVDVAPEQYQWEYKRFKRPPTLGKDNIYRRQ